jgi:hypothetical protein
LPREVVVVAERLGIGLLLAAGSSVAITGRGRNGDHVDPLLRSKTRGKDWRRGRGVELDDDLVCPSGQRQRVTQVVEDIAFLDQWRGDEAAIQEEAAAGEGIQDERGPDRRRDGQARAQAQAGLAPA